MMNYQFFMTIQLCIYLSSCGGGTRTYVDYSKADSSPYWTGSLFEKAYIQFHGKDYDKAKALFTKHMLADSLVMDYEAYAFLAECHNRLGESESGKRKVRFKPGKLKGKLSKVWVMLPVQFRLR